MALAKVTLRKQGVTPYVRNVKIFLKVYSRKKYWYYDFYPTTGDHDESWCIQGFEIVAEGLENPAMRELVLKVKLKVAALLPQL